MGVDENTSVIIKMRAVASPYFALWWFRPRDLLDFSTMLVPSVLMNPDQLAHVPMELNPPAYVLMVLPQQESLLARMVTSLFVLAAYLPSAMMDLTQTQDPFPHALMDLQGVKTVDQFLVLMELESHLLLQTLLVKKLFKFFKKFRFCIG